MAKSLSIPNGSPVRWLINVVSASGSINAGSILRNNEAWPHGQTFCGIYYPVFHQPFDCDDTTEIQIIHENTDDPDIVLEIRSYDDDSIVLSLPFVVDSGNYKRASVDFSLIDCDACYYLQLTTLDFGGSVWGCGDAGTFEAGIALWNVSYGLGLTIYQNGIAHSGTYAAQLVSSASPTVAERTILYCTNDFNNIGQNQYFEVSGWVYDIDIVPFTQDFAEVFWELTTGFTDAVIISETRVTPSEDGRSMWHQFSMIFKTGSDDTGSIRIKTTATPQAGGYINIDDLRLAGANTIKEAHTEPIKVSNLSGCDKGIRYYSDSPSHGFYYDGTWENFMRLPVRLERERFEDPRFKMHRSSNGAASLLSSRLVRVYEGQTPHLPPWFLEKVAISMKHQHLFINNVEYRALEAPFQPEFPDDFASGSAEFKVIDSEYQQQYTYGG